MTDRQPSWPVAARDALPPISGHGSRHLTPELTGAIKIGDKGGNLVERPVQRLVRLRTRAMIQDPVVMRAATALAMHRHGLRLYPV